MNLVRQPIYLFADSQLLFWKEKGALFLNTIRQRMTRDEPRAAYLGASNGDDPRFYSLFEAAMEAIGVENCRMITSSFSSDDSSFISEAEIILLAGGDVERGWKVFEQTGQRESVIKRYQEGALLIGISAGAAHLGLFGLVREEGLINTLIDTFKLVPFIIDAHAQSDEWSDLRAGIQLLDDSAEGIGIPAGGGMIYYPDGAVEAIRYPLAAFTMKDGALRHYLLMPDSEASISPRE